MGLVGSVAIVITRVGPDPVGYFAPVLSASALTPEWAVRLLNQCVRRPVTEFGAELLPIRRDDVDVPAALAAVRAADFASSYEAGWNTMWERITTIQITLAARLASLDLWVGTRGVHFAEGVRRPSTVGVAQAGNLTGVAVVNGVGPAHLSSELAAIIANELQATLDRPGIALTDAAISFLSAANDATHRFRSEFHAAADSERLGAGMAVVCLSDTEGFVATLGAPSALIKSTVGENSQFLRFQSTAQGQFRLADQPKAIITNSVISLFSDAPLGHLKADSTVVQRPFSLSGPGDFIALVTMPLRAHAERLEAVLGNMLNGIAAADRRKVSVRLHEPESDDASCAVLAPTTRAVSQS